MKLDILVIAVHPDDSELCCSGTILKHIAEGKKVGIVDLTRGELGTRGSAEMRDKEAADAAEILGLSVRENLRMRDGFFAIDEENQRKIISVIRKYQPDIILTNAEDDRHSDHGRAAQLVEEATFMAGLVKITTENGTENQEPWRPSLLLHFIQDRFIKPDILIDISDFWEKKVQSILAYRSQFHVEDYVSNELQTYISNPGFLKNIEARHRELGKYIGAEFAEGFTCRRYLGVNDLFSLR
ncbi:MAG: bacillithiol biosynthesis deacetylase BshB1 [Mucilaginibacter polytrichastri]|nr:bacillithiol biosynthesis deacetylase BshB1 [Mucilaginibacter polytrichastri]